MSKLEHPPSHLGEGSFSLGRMRRFSYIERMFKLIEGVEGDVVECGIGRGDTFAMLAYLVGREGKNRTLRGFDSFEGFPNPTEHDASWRNPKKGEWSFGENVVRELLEESGVLSEFPKLEIQIKKGYFGETLPKEGDYKIAFLHADGDLYESYHDTLTNFWERISEGGVILFDEYKEFKPNPKTGIVEEKWPGATKAINEFFGADGPRPSLDEETGKYFLIKK